jgi:hypothetical protein
MSRYEILNSEGVVENVIEADEGYMGTFYSGRYRKAYDPFEFPKETSVTKNGFMNRFTAEEWDAINNSTNGNVERFKRKTSLELMFNLASDETKMDLEMLVAEGVLTEERKQVILTTPLNENTEQP